MRLARCLLRAWHVEDEAHGGSGQANKGLYLGNSSAVFATSLRRLDVAGVKDPYAAQRDGISLGPLLRGEAAALENPDTHRVGILVREMGCWDGWSALGRLGAGSC